MPLTPEESARAAAIVDRWFWQLDESRQYRYKSATKRIVRFYESAPLSADVFRLVLEYLSAMEGLTEVNVNHKKVELDGTWNALGAWYATAPGEKWSGTDSSKVRVYQALVQAGEADDETYVVEDGCKYKVSHEFHWDVAGQPEIPKSSSGVQYTVQGLTRDKESGLYSYVIEKRETVQQDIDLYTSSVTLFEKRDEEAHLGVKDTDVARTGSPASAAGGVIVERSVTKNPDCTSDVRNATITEQAVAKSRRTTRTTPFRTVVTFRDTATEAHAEAAPTDFPIDAVAPYNPETATPDGAGTAREVSVEATRGSMRTTEKVYVFPKAVSWSTPELSTNFRYMRTWYFRNFSETQYHTLMTQIAEYLNAKIINWAKDDRAPQTHTIDPGVSLNEDGFFDGQVSIRASWSEDSAGIEGNKEYIISDFSWIYWSFNYRSDKAVQTNYAGYSVFLGYNGVKIKMRRITGCGKGLLEKFLKIGEKKPFCGQAPQFSYNPITHVWHLELVTGIDPQYTDGSVETLIPPGALSISTFYNGIRGPDSDVQDLIDGKEIDGETTSKREGRFDNLVLIDTEPDTSTTNFGSPKKAS